MPRNTDETNIDTGRPKVTKASFRQYGPHLVPTRVSSHTTKRSSRDVMKGQAVRESWSTSVAELRSRDKFFVIHPRPCSAHDVVYRTRPHLVERKT